MSVRVSGRQAMVAILLAAVVGLPAALGPSPVVDVEARAAGAAALGQIPKDVLVIGRVISDAVSLDPAQAFEFTTVWVVANLYNQLVQFSPDFQRVLPELAESWTASDGGRTYTFKIRQGVKFHSGNPVTAKAAEYSYRRVLALDLPPSFIMTSFIDKPEDIVALDDYTLQITFNQPMPEQLMASVMANWVASVVDPAVVEQHATADDPWANGWLSANEGGAGSGPFKLVAWERNVKIEMEAFADYWKGEPALKRVILQEMPEPTAQLLALQRGDIDVAMDLLPKQYKELEGQPGIRITRSPTFSLHYLAVNAGKEPFTSVEVRNAIRWALDYEAIQQGIWEGALADGQTVITPGMIGHLDEKPFRKDPELARALLAQAGYPDGFKVELLTSPTPPRPDVAAKIQEDLAEIGVEVEIKVLRSAEMLGIYRAQEHDMVLLNWGADYPDADALAKAFADYDIRQLAWRNQWDDPIKYVVKAAAVEQDPEARAALYEAIQRYTLYTGPFAILGYPIQQFAVRETVKGFEATPAFYFFSLFGVSKD